MVKIEGEIDIGILLHLLLAMILALAGLRFPANEDAGNLARVLGIEPFSWFLETLKFINSAVKLLDEKI